MPGISSSGILKPISMIKIFPRHSKIIIFRPTSPKPPKGMILRFDCLNDFFIVKLCGQEPSTRAQLGAGLVPHRTKFWCGRFEPLILWAGRESNPQAFSAYGPEPYVFTSFTTCPNSVMPAPSENPNFSALSLRVFQSGVLGFFYNFCF